MPLYVLSEDLRKSVGLEESSAVKGSLDFVIKKIQRATDENDHTGSWIILSREILKDKKLVDAFKAVEAISDYFGYLTAGAGKARDELAGVAIEAGKRMLSPEDWERVYGAF
jgi:hypothetical protein